MKLFFILMVSWTQWTLKYLNEYLILWENLSVLDWANKCKVDMILLEQHLLKIVEAQRELPILSLVYFKKPADGRFWLSISTSFNCFLSSPFLFAEILIILERKIVIFSQLEKHLPLSKLLTVVDIRHYI